MTRTWCGQVRMIKALRGKLDHGRHPKLRDKEFEEKYECMYVLTIKTLSIKKAITSVGSKLIGETC